MTPKDMKGWWLFLLGERTLVGSVSVGRLAKYWVSPVYELTLAPARLPNGDLTYLRGIQTVLQIDDIEGLEIPDTTPSVNCQELGEARRVELCGLIDAIEQAKRAASSGLVLA